MFSASASNISSVSWSGSQSSVDESVDSKERRYTEVYRENVSPRPKLKGFQTDELHPKTEAENIEKEKCLQAFAAEEKEFKEQSEAQQLKRAKHKLLQRHPVIRAFDKEFENQMVRKENKDSMSLREQMNRKKKESEKQEHEEMMRMVAKMDTYKEYSALQRQLLEQRMVEINQKLIEEKRQMREMEKLEREEREALTLMHERDVLNYRETTAEKREKQQKNPITPLRAKEDIQRKRHDEEEFRIQMETDMTQQKRKNDREMQRCRSQTVSDQLLQKDHPARMTLEQKALDKADKHLEEEMDKKAEETKAYFKEMQIKERRERPETQASYESGRLHDIEETRKARLYGDANYDLAMERREHTMKLIKTEEEASLKSSAEPAEQVKEIKDYIRSKLTMARERGLDVEALLSLNVGNCGMFLSEERPDIYSVFPSDRGIVSRLAPLPHYGTDDTRRVKHMQALGGFTVPLPNKNPATLPPLKNCMTKIKVRDLLRDETPLSPVSEMK